jgi:hypothetical protein
MRQTGLGSIFQSREQAHDHISNRMVENICNYIACVEDSSFYAALQAIIQNVEDMRGSGFNESELEDPAFVTIGQLIGQNVERHK